MLIVAHKGREREVADIFRKWDLDAVVIGQVRDDGRMRVTHIGELVCDVPVKALTDEAPVYERPLKAGSADVPSALSAPDPLAYAGETPALPANTAPVNVLAAKTDPTLTEEPAASVGGGTDVVSPAPPTAPNLGAAPNHNDALLRLLASPNLASKEGGNRQYDHWVRTNTAVLPGADAAVVRIKETRKALAIALDGNGRYCAANPREGAKLMVAEAARNVVCVGAKPIAITNCLNFASPERPEVMWSFSEVVDGIAEACRAFDTPVVSGNVSFYNETEGRGILPTPVIGMLGLIEDVKRVIQPGFKNAGDFVALLGATHEDLSISEYAAVIEGRSSVQITSEGRVPVLDLDAERAVQAACLRAAEAGLLRSAHDCADGGLAVALAECCFSSLNREVFGADIDLTGDYDLATRLFSESPSRIIISFDESALGDIEELVAASGCPMTLLGNVGSDRLRIESDGAEVIQMDVAETESAWRGSLASKLQAEAMAAGAE